MDGEIKLEDIIKFAQEQKCILTWEFQLAPQEYQFRDLSGHEEKVTFIPDTIESNWLEMSVVGKWAIGESYQHKVRGGILYISGLYVPHCKVCGDTGFIGILHESFISENGLCLICELAEEGVVMDMRKRIKLLKGD